LRHLYRIDNDTIKVKYVIPNSRKWFPNGYEAWYKIIDKNTIESLVYSNWGKITKETAEKINNNVVNKSDYYAKFIPCDTLPDPNNKNKKR